MATTPLNVPIPSIQQLADNQARLLQQGLADAAQAGSPVPLSATDLDLSRSNVRALSFTRGMSLHGAYRYLRDFIAPQAVPIKAVGDFLDGWLVTYQMPRKPAVAAVLAATGTGVNGTVLAASTLMQSGDGRQYATTAAATVASGVLTVQVAALVEGAAGNLASALPLTLVSPVSGIDSAFVAGAATTTGTDLESDADAVYRLQQRLSAVPMGGCPADYARWALAVPGITRAWGVRNPGGPTTAGVIIMADVGGVSTLPSGAQRTAVEDYIRDPRRGPPDELFVIVPTPVAINFTIHLAPDTAAIRAGVVAALADLFFREAAPGQPIPMSHATEAISSVVGEFNHTISAPAITSGGFFTVASYNQLLTLGTVTFT